MLGCEVIDHGYWHSINIVNILSADRIGFLKCPARFWRFGIRKMVLQDNENYGFPATSEKPLR